jgi:hypothetical protein
MLGPFRGSLLLAPWGWDDPRAWHVRWVPYVCSVDLDPRTCSVCLDPGACSVCSDPCAWSLRGELVVKICHINI